MGTRHLIAVMKDGEYKVAQYGQWDGYPREQGLKVLKFLRNADLEIFKKALDRTRFLDPEGKDKQFLEDYERNAPEWSDEPDNRTLEQHRWFSNYISRDLGAGILKNVLESQDEEIVLNDNIDFAGDSLFCEYAYVIDLDASKFEIYKGLNDLKEPKGERFENSPRGSNSSYYPVKLWKIYDLKNLPTYEQFLEDLKEEEEED